MTGRAQELLERALALPEQERAELAGTLLDSLERITDADAESAWQKEVARRMAELDSGKARTTPWEEVRSQMVTRLAHGRKKS